MTRRRAYAKVNWALEVLGRRADGYHEIVSVIETIGLYDTVEVSAADELTLRCSIAELETPDNLAFRAASLLRQACGHRSGAAIRIEKAIPLAAGLGGGSTDAAAALQALNELWGLGLPVESLGDIGAKLGSDVPFFVGGGAALVRGRGERVEPLTSPPQCWLVLLPTTAAIPDKTRTMYSRLTPATFTSGAAALALADRFRAGRPAGDDDIVNAFDEIADDVFDGLRERRRRIAATCGRRAHLAGSGPSLFVLADGEVEARALAAALHRDGFDALAVPTVGAAEDSDE